MQLLVVNADCISLDDLEYGFNSCFEKLSSLKSKAAKQVTKKINQIISSETDNVQK